MKWLHILKYVVAGVCIVGAFVGGIFFEILTDKLKKELEQENLEFSRNISVNSMMMATLFTSTPTFNAAKLLSSKAELTSEDKVAVGDLFAKILERVSREKFCSGGSYEVRPIYRYEEGARNIIGQELDSRLQCKITKEQLESYSALLHDLDRFVSESGYATLNIPALEQTFSTEEMNENEDKMYEELLLKASKYAESYSKILNRQCRVVTMQIGNGHIVPRMLAASPMADGGSLRMAKNTTPIVQDREFSSQAVVQFSCR
ncbi:hypothetical protein CCZ01_06235 [Helicobacter monodelphidis]|uniref:SIMPL domain-containing protein n=1 Tax=Helicobacter sp. 15-1451 TaxID=2004995 RepID=UPI000DCD1E75|nr:SIMPL domain-containing protein [Helicobacter sp. 15-1451]RAX57433.1 hypothetical protein CCZ01_06235 [Helicobacter sp. 15-1451]